jgi:hypothetical protein
MRSIISLKIDKKNSLEKLRWKQVFSYCLSILSIVFDYNREYNFSMKILFL